MIQIYFARKSTQAASLVLRMKARPLATINQALAALIIRKPQSRYTFPLLRRHWLRGRFRCFLFGSFFEGFADVFRVQHITKSERVVDGSLLIL